MEKDNPLNHHENVSISLKYNDATCTNHIVHLKITIEKGEMSWRHSLDSVLTGLRLTIVE